MNELLTYFKTEIPNQPDHAPSADFRAIEVGIWNQTRENTFISVEEQLPSNGNFRDVEKNGCQIVKVCIFVEVFSIENVNELIEGESG